MPNRPGKSAYEQNRHKDGRDRDGPGNVQQNNRGPKLLHQAGAKYKAQPEGKGIGVGGSEVRKAGCGYHRAAHHDEILRNHERKQ